MASFARVIAIVMLPACVDTPVLLPPLHGGPRSERLSELGLFDGAPASQAAAAGVVPYDVIAPLWSDGAAKHRFIAAPTPLGATDDHWEVPAGTYLVKTFYFPRDLRTAEAGVQLLETRIIRFVDDGAEMATYVWNASQTDAVASGGNLDMPVDFVDAEGTPRHQTHHVPGTSQCDSCHDGGALGIRTPQLAPQLAMLIDAGVVDHAPDQIIPFVDPLGDAPLDARAASYLDANCAHCHRPGGDAGGTHADWRREHVLDNVCREARHGLDGRTLVIAPGRPDDSIAIVRMKASDPFVHMPRGPSHVVDAAGLAMLTDWIASLPRVCP
jgi:hypothetical protein